MKETGFRYIFPYNLKHIFSDFVKISDYFVNYLGTNWWYLNGSRLDLRQAGGINFNKISDLEKNGIKKNYLIILRYHLKNIFFIFSNIIKKKIQLNEEKNYILIEEIFNENKNFNIVDYYFKNIFKNQKYKVIKIGLGVRKKKNEINLIDLCDFKDIIICYIQAIIINIKYKKLKKKLESINLNHKEFWFYYFEIKENVTNFKNLFVSKLVERIFVKNSSEGINLYYPYEEKPFERALNYSNEKKKLNTTYAYYGNPQDHHSLFLRKFKKFNIPRPSVFLCSGDFQKKQLTKFHNKEIYIIGSDKSKKKIEKNIKYDFLVFISHEIELESFTQWVKDYKYNTNIKFLIRIYSQLENFKNNSNLSYLKKLSNFYFSENTFDEDVKNCKFSIFSRTSAGPQAVNSGLLSIWADFSQVGSNALFNNLNDFFPSFNTNQLFKNVSLFVNFDEKSLKSHLQTQEKVTSKIYSNINYTLINKLFKESNIKFNKI